MSDYKRLTKRDKEFGIIAMCPACSRNATCKEQGECVACVDEVYNRLAELEDKIENGTLVEVGYLIEKGVKNHDDQRYNIVKVVDKEYLLYINLTKAEAEQKLKELKDSE